MNKCLAIHYDNCICQDELEEARKEIVKMRKMFPNWSMEKENLEAQIEEAHKETLEQCRLLGISGSKEARLLAQLEEARKDLNTQNRKSRLLGYLLQCSVEKRNSLEALVPSYKHFLEILEPYAQKGETCQQAAKRIVAHLSEKDAVIEKAREALEHIAIESPYAPTKIYARNVLAAIGERK